MVSLLTRYSRNNGVYSDLKINCGSSRFDVHRVIVCPQSAFFTKAMEGGFQEAKSNEITLHDNPTIEISATTAPSEEKDCPSVPLQDAKETKVSVNAKMHVLADKYAVERLKDHSKEKLKANLTHEWNDTDFLWLIEYTYGPHSRPNPELRGVIVTFAVQHLSTLDKLPQFHQVHKEFSEFGSDLLTRTIERVVQLEKYI
ncbi:BTB/POZ domain-containing protein [Aspergillus alliaceus]|uniref:BTB/POZ domain-containing protein n=1 Tax=Petromyces alliaceus TaxID=209559 RepID=UPI0012A6AF8F|nr:uncharacterized protein BDW43DRAFT_296409 [Aspergillus alliaceus]KAB8239055.1 hypothetical protein BDW43DRAFT_296409 [Aspergillus alliaceus]